MIRKTAVISRWGNSLAIRLPKDMLNESCFTENDRVELIADKTGIKIRKVKKNETLDDLFKEYNGKQKYQEVDTSVVGNEVI